MAVTKLLLANHGRWASAPSEALPEGPNDSTSPDLDVVLSERQRAMNGYLLLADISGYTAFLTGTELEHSHAIVADLTRLMRTTLVPPLRFVKLEGDAVFCFADADAFTNGEQLVELVESCYFDFSSRLLDMTRSTTCRCDACRAIGGLDLKFVAHFGTFIVDRGDEGRIDLCAPDGTLAHPLLKNTIIDTGGPGAYGFFTDACLIQTATELPLRQRPCRTRRVNSEDPEDEHRPLGGSLRCDRTKARFLSM